MIFLSILIALVLERVTPQFVELRQTSWLADFSEWLNTVLHIDRLSAWPALAVIIFPLFLLVWIVSGMFENAFFGLFELAFNVAVVFFCVGPKALDLQVDNYLDALEIGDAEQRFTVASQITSEAPANDLGTQVTQVARAIFSEANRRVFAVLFWFVVLGPVAAVLYRLVEQLGNAGYLHASLDSVRQLSQKITGWIEWLPTRITLFVFMVSGNFEAGLQNYRQDTAVAIDLDEQNQQLLKNVGFHCIARHQVADEEQGIDLVRKSRGLVLRSAIVWLCIIGVIIFLK